MPGGVGPLGGTNSFGHGVRVKEMCEERVYSEVKLFGCKPLCEQASSQQQWTTGKIFVGFRVNYRVRDARFDETFSRDKLDE